MKPKHKSGNVRSGRSRFSSNGGLEQPDRKARYVASEVNTVDTTHVFAATPPLEAERLLFSQFASARKRDGPPLQLHVADACKAYFNGTKKKALLEITEGCVVTFQSARRA